MSKFGEDLIEGLTEAVDFARGDKGGARVHVVEMPDVRAIRRRLHMSQHEFADAFRIPVATLKNWEQGRRVPDAPAVAYLQVIARRPKEIQEALRQG
jgi:putative transcriptional regulator